MSSRRAINDKKQNKRTRRESIPFLHAFVVSLVVETYLSLKYFFFLDSLVLKISELLNVNPILVSCNCSSDTKPYVRVKG